MTLSSHRARAPASIVSHALAAVAVAVAAGSGAYSAPAARGCVCCLPPPSLPPRPSLAGQQLGEAVRGEETGGPTPHIPCRTAPVLRWPGHLSPDWARGLPGGLGNRMRHRAGTQGGCWPQGQANLEWDPASPSECSTPSPQPLGCMYYYLPRTNKEIKAQKIRVIVALSRDCLLASRTPPNTCKCVICYNLFKPHKNSGYNSRPIFTKETESQRGEGTHSRSLSL